MAPAKAALVFCLLYTTAAVYSASDVLEIKDENDLGSHFSLFRIYLYHTGKHFINQ